MDHILFLFFLFLINKYSLKKKEREALPMHTKCVQQERQYYKEKEKLSMNQKKKAPTH